MLKPHIHSIQKAHTHICTCNGPETICIDSHAHWDQRVEIYGQAFSIPLGAQVWKLRWTIHVCKMWSSTQLLLFIRIYTRLCVTFLFDKCRHVLVKPHHPTTTTTKKALVKNGNSIEKARWRAMQEAKKKPQNEWHAKFIQKKNAHTEWREREYLKLRRGSCIQLDILEQHEKAAEERKTERENHIAEITKTAITKGENKMEYEKKVAELKALARRQELMHTPNPRTHAHTHIHRRADTHQLTHTKSYTDNTPRQVRTASVPSSAASHIPFPFNGYVRILPKNETKETESKREGRKQQPKKKSNSRC